MDVDGRAEVVEDLIERSESGVVAPAVDVSGLDVEDLLSEPLGDELRDAGLAGAAGAGDDGGIGGFAVRDGIEDAGEVVYLGVAMLNFPRDEPGAEDASTANHALLTDCFHQVLKTRLVISGKKLSAFLGFVGDRAWSGGSACEKLVVSGNFQNRLYWTLKRQNHYNDSIELLVDGDQLC